MVSIAATSSLSIFCRLSPKSSEPIQSERIRSIDPPSSDTGKILLQPRLCTLRSYGDKSPEGMIGRLMTIKENINKNNNNFFSSLADYIESSRKSQDFEVVSGRLAMIAFAAATSVESVTGNSIFKKLEPQQVTEAAGLCVAVVAFAATFAYFSSAKGRIGQMFTLSCNQLVDSLIDDLVDGLFYDADQSDNSDDI